MCYVVEVVLHMIEAEKDVRYVLYAPEVVYCVQLCMLDVVDDEICLLEILEVVEALGMLDALEALEEVMELFKKAPEIVLRAIVNLFCRCQPNQQQLWDTKP